MKLSAEQIAFYNENGYLLIENFFSNEEVAKLYAELPNTIEENSPRIVLEENGAIRSVFAPHFVNNTYERLGRLERLIVPAEQLIGSKVYLHQYKINTKKALKGDWWEWHQDFPYWHIDDAIMEPQLVSVMLYLQDTDALNGALLVIPGSHKLGIVQFAEKDLGEMSKKIENNDVYKHKEYLSSLGSDLKFTVDHNLLKEQVSKNGIVAASGKKGAVLFFHGNIFHASNNNLTPFDRDAVLITYNSINNIPGQVQNPRPGFLAGKDYDPIEKVEKAFL
jgi:ectoine hydroxylase